MNSLFDEVQELGSKAGDYERLSYAWERFDLLKSNADQLMLIVNFYVFISAALTFSTVLVTVLAGTDLEVGFSKTSLGALAVVLPVMAGLACKYSFFNPF